VLSIYRAFSLPPRGLVNRGFTVNVAIIFMSFLSAVVQNEIEDKLQIKMPKLLQSSLDITWGLTKGGITGHRSLYLLQ